jgi:hypothetical protein
MHICNSLARHAVHTCSATQTRQGRTQDPCSCSALLQDAQGLPLVGREKIRQLWFGGACRCSLLMLSQGTNCNLQVTTVAETPLSGRGSWEEIKRASAVQIAETGLGSETRYTCFRGSRG